MKYIVSRYNQDIDWLKEYTDDVVLYDRSEEPLANAIVVPNIGTDIADKLRFIIENYDNLPDVAVYTKANLFKYITKEEFDKVKDNKTFTPLLTQFHSTTKSGVVDISYYHGRMYHEINNLWYLGAHPVKYEEHAEELQRMLGIYGLSYLPFAPGSNYILPKENILKHSKDFYDRLRNYLMWDRYPGEAQIIERGLFTLWR